MFSFKQLFFALRNQLCSVYENTSFDSANAEAVITTELDYKLCIFEDEGLRTDDRRVYTVEVTRDIKDG